ncbi:MAG: hypothetical protein VZT48_09805 [Bulleidia sp.]|nr:hypothetical protein [Bulleidia sp.]
MVFTFMLLCAYFFWMSYLNTGTDQKNIRSFSSYPEKVQEELRISDPELVKKAKIHSKVVVFFKDLPVYAILLAAADIPARSDNVFENFIHLLIMGEGLNLFDLLVIDLLWWRHSPRIRFSKVQEADMYLDPEKHISAFLRGVLLFVCTAAVGTWLMKILFV